MSRNSRDPCPPSTGLGALEPAFKHMIAEAANRNLINQLLDIRCSVGTFFQRKIQLPH